MHNERLIEALSPTRVTLNPDDAIGDRHEWPSASSENIPMKLLKRRMKVVGDVAQVRPKQADPHYLSGDWAARRQRIFARDHYTCVVPGCSRPAKVCEHIISRRKGGTDDDSNLCSLCREHDNRFKEDANGERRNAEEWSKIFRRG